jgi:hypothetical protein
LAGVVVAALRLRRLKLVNEDGVLARIGDKDFAAGLSAWMVTGLPLNNSAQT